MKNKGFTIVELLCVIAVLGALVILVTPLVNKLSLESKEKMFETKISSLKSAATIYAQDNYSKISKNAEETINSDNETVYTINIKVKDLVPEYYLPEEDYDGGLVIDPRDKTLYLDDYIITIEINKINHKIKAYFQEESNEVTT